MMYDVPNDVFILLVGHTASKKYIINIIIIII